MSPQVTRLEVLAVAEKWNVTERGIGRLSSHATKVEATEKAREVAMRNTPSELIIRKMDGTIESERTFSHQTPAK